MLMIVYQIKTVKICIKFQAFHLVGCTPHKELNLSDAEDGDLIHIDDEVDEIANGATDVMVYWHLGLKNYVIKN